MQDITVIILTYNEEKHIERCIGNVKGIAKEIFVVDSFSTDNTLNLAEKLGANVFQNPFVNQAIQFNWALDNLPIRTTWILRLDADEYLTEDLHQEIETKLPSISDHVSGIILPLRRIFLGRTIKRGTGKIKILRLFRYKKAICEERWMDEHMQIIEGTTLEFENEFTDNNLNSIGWWTQKHNSYSIREAIDLMNLKINLLPKKQNISRLSDEAENKRKRKLKYAKKPLFWRAFAYFIYRYFFKLGFTEGKEGFLWHFLQGWWFRTLVDAKIYEIKKECGNDVLKIKTYIKENYNIDLF